jgi:alkanesulfonate monooxygenase SsuD/methylene tetrahydromethanopterin reductase-like flavin-dependent oxidoreductase (luciferase family)
MHFGLFNLMTKRDRSLAPRQVYADTLEHVRLAEEMGFEIAWFAEHHFSNYCLCPSPLAMAIYAAPQTKRIRLGPAVIVAPLYQPLRMLEEISMLDTLSDGRLVLGLGSGYQQYEFHKFGVDLKSSRDIFLETLDVVEAFLQGGALRYEGKYLRIPETHFIFRTLQARPDVYIAGLLQDPVTQERIARAGYVPFFTTGWSTLEEIAQVREKVGQFHRAAGKDPATMNFAIQQYIYVTDNRSEALKAAEAARYIRRIAAAMRENYARIDGAYLQEVPAAGEPPLEEIADRMIIGDAETCTEKLLREVETLRFSHLSCFMGLPGLPQRSILRSMERFGAEVMPRLKKAFREIAA